MHEVAPAEGWYWPLGQGLQTRSEVAVGGDVDMKPGWQTLTAEQGVLTAPPQVPLAKKPDWQVEHSVQRPVPELTSFQ